MISSFVFAQDDKYNHIYNCIPPYPNCIYDCMPTCLARRGVNTRINNLSLWGIFLLISTKSQTRQDIILPKEQRLPRWIALGWKKHQACAPGREYQNNQSVSLRNLLADLYEELRDVINFPSSSLRAQRGSLRQLWCSFLFRQKEIGLVREVDVPTENN